MIERQLTYFKIKDKELFMNWNDKVTMRNKITDPFTKLILLLYTYISPRIWEDYYSLYYLNKLLDKMLKADKESKLYYIRLLIYI